jgi:hypothetical protein
MDIELTKCPFCNTKQLHKKIGKEWIKFHLICYECNELYDGCDPENRTTHDTNFNMFISFSWSFVINRTILYCEMKSRESGIATSHEHMAMIREEPLFHPEILREMFIQELCEIEEKADKISEYADDQWWNLVI